MGTREPTTLGAIAVPGGLAVIDTAMAVGAVGGPVGLLAAGAVAGTAGVAAAAAKKRGRSKAASKTMAGSAKRGGAPKSSGRPKAGKAGAGRAGGKATPKTKGLKASDGGKAPKSSRGNALKKMAGPSKGATPKRATTAKASKTTGGKGAGLGGKRGSMFSAAKRGDGGKAPKGTGGKSGLGKTGAGRKSGRGKAGFGVASRKLARSSKGSKGQGRLGVRLSPKRNVIGKTAAAVRKAATRGGRSPILGPPIRAITAAGKLGKFWRDKKATPGAEDAVDRRMRAMTAQPAPAAFAEPVTIALPAEPEQVPLPSLKPQQKGKIMSVPHKFHAAIEAMDVAFASFDPHNARAVEAYYAGVAELAGALSGGLTVGGIRITEDFPIDPAAGEYVSGLGHHMGSLHEHIEEATAAFKSAHADQLDRINSGDTRQVKWDYAANQE